ncbi:MAG: hypothetical protein IT445_08340 [Phycisphaeraceae bacterium]|nr:hypothetical protein [Phycisphaeraceae bacterium]
MLTSSARTTDVTLIAPDVCSDFAAAIMQVIEQALQQTPARRMTVGSSCDNIQPPLFNGITP